MRITIRLRLRPAQCVWLILMVIVIAKTTTRVSAASRGVYYGRRMKAREPPIQHISSSLFYGSSPKDKMPSCGQLRYIWKTSVKNFRDNSINNNNENNNLDTNEIPMIFSSPYYSMLLSEHIMQPHILSYFGKIVNEPQPPPLQESPPPPIRSNRVPIHNSRDNDRLVDANNNNNNNNLASDVSYIPGRFMDKPSQIGVIYGHVINSPDEATQRTVVYSEPPDHNYHNSNDGVFGKFVTQVDDTGEETKESPNYSMNKNSRPQTTPVKQQRTGSNSFSSADDFFKSGVWHNKPVIPSVTFQH